MNRVVSAKINERGRLLVLLIQVDLLSKGDFGLRAVVVILVVIVRLVLLVISSRMRTERPVLVARRGGAVARTFAGFEDLED